MISTKLCRNWALGRHLAHRAKVMAQVRCYNTPEGPYQAYPTKVDIGKREVVGYGTNGEETYMDLVQSPYPAIRFQEDKGDIVALREKEKGDWKKLTIAEKKGLYRASFMNTLAEIEAPSGEWRFIIGGTLCIISTALSVYIILRNNVMDPLPDTITDDKKVLAQIHRMVKLNVEPIMGVSSWYDYEKDKWKHDKS